MNEGRFFIRRLGRLLLWRSPSLYRHIGLARGRGDCREHRFDMWIGGFPRSANTFALEAFQMANPGVRIASHRHIPTFIIAWLGMGKPGMFLIREPQDAVVSWAIVWNGHVDECLNYYLDYHYVLAPFAERLFTVTFDEVTRDFGEVVRRFNQRFGTRYTPFQHKPETVSECFERIEKNSPLSGSEHTVCRPSDHRRASKAAWVEHLHAQPMLQQKLAKARKYYDFFTASEGLARERNPLHQPGHENGVRLRSPG